ncbi:hypothetical protein EVA_13601 [gut metagenome]|uniref:Uncharacterized protein n=1 Tax=gut metagenome TaxID=749906 RepID=J9FUW4_9ZZZZ
MALLDGRRSVPEGITNALLPIFLESFSPRSVKATILRDWS